MRAHHRDTHAEQSRGNRTNAIVGSMSSLQGTIQESMLGSLLWLALTWLHVSVAKSYSPRMTRVGTAQREKGRGEGKDIEDTYEPGLRWW